MSIEITPPKVDHNNTEGLCGNNNAVENDDVDECEEDNSGRCISHKFAEHYRYIFVIVFDM